MESPKKPAPGAPGVSAPWTSGAKTGIGRAVGAGSEVCFTIGKGILNEVYFPQADIACIRECVFLVSDGGQYFSDERVVTRETEEMAVPGVPAYLIRNRCHRGQYRLEKTVLSDPGRNSVIQRVRFEPARPGLHLYVCLTPHLHNHGDDNMAWIGEYKGMEMLFASSDGMALALACSSGWAQATVGFTGISDAYRDIRDHRRLTVLYDSAQRGNVMLGAEIRWERGQEYAGNTGPGDKAAGSPAADIVIAIGFGHTAEEAAFQAKASLLEGFDSIYTAYVRDWIAWQDGLRKQWRKVAARGRWIPQSIAALHVAESCRYPGGVIASLAVPWGEVKTGSEGLGYHLVWVRDLVETAWAFLALGATGDLLRIVNYLFTTQDTDGKWPQNMWLDGRPCLEALQMDQVALPVLLMHSCFSRGLLDDQRVQSYLPGVRKAVEFIMAAGPYSPQDRWEQQAGLSPFTLAAQVAALASAAELLEAWGDTALARACGEVADTWNAQIETWTYVRDTFTARRYGVEGYYIRVNPFRAPIDEVKEELVNIHHHPDGSGKTPVGEVIAVDALALVRFGLRRADDPRILDTVRVIDGELQRSLPAGPGWRRFSKDAYGESDAGDPYQQSGKGRCWPLLTGERAHYEIAAGHYHQARRLLRTMEGLSHEGLLPEQVWDAEDIPSKDLYKGRYTGSAMPLTWAQAEYIKLCVSIRRREVFDLPSAAVKRFLK